jgi:hypothetical protein
MESAAGMGVQTMTDFCVFCLLFVGLAMWAMLPIRLVRKHHTRHYRNVLARVAERRTHVLVYWWLHRPETERAQ